MAETATCDVKATTEALDTHMILKPRTAIVFFKYTLFKVFSLVFGIQ
jgi:hypothetical protein